MIELKYRTMAMSADEVDYADVFEGRDYEIIEDRYKDAFETWQRQLLSVGMSPAVLMEDDIILADGFLEDIEKAIAENPEKVLSFFTLKTIPETVELRGSTYMSNLCYYLPAFEANNIYWYSKEWLESDRGIEHPDGVDLCVADYLDEIKETYIMVIPNLVQHKEQPSRLGPRSSKRQTKYFKDDM